MQHEVLAPSRHTDRRSYREAILATFHRLASAQGDVLEGLEDGTYGKTRSSHPTAATARELMAGRAGRRVP
jgi:hypothetical protein